MSSQGGVRWGLQVQALLALAVGLAVTFASEIVVGVALAHDGDAVSQLTGDRALQVDNLELVVAMVNQETGLRGYAATGQPAFLEPYETGRADAVPLLRRLSQESLGTPFQGAMSEAAGAASAWVTWADSRKAAVDAAGAAVLDPAADEVGKTRFDAFRSADARLTGLIQARVQRLLAAATQSRDQVGRVGLAGGVLVLGSLLVLGAILMVSTLRPVQQLAATADRLARGVPGPVPYAGRRDEVGSLAHALREWRTAEQMREAMLEHAPIGISHLGADGRVLAANDGMAALFRGTREQVLTISFGDMDAGPRETGEPSLALYRQVRSGRKPRGTLQKWYRRLDGSTFWGELTLIGVRDSEGVVRSTVAMLADVTVRKEKLDRAAAVQRGLLPKIVPMLRGYELTGHCVLAEEIGGDFFDWYLSRPDELTLTLGDVMGKGMSAAILMATVRATLRATANAASPGDAVQVTDRAAASDLEESQAFVTLLHGRLDQATGELRFVDAGHGFVFLLRASGEVVTFPRGNLPLGVLAGQEYAESSALLEPGDTFIVFSDGVLDLFPELEQDFGQLGRILTGASTAIDMVERLCAGASGGQQYDDVTVVALRRSTNSSGAAVPVSSSDRPPATAVRSRLVSQ